MVLWQERYLLSPQGRKDIASYFFTIIRLLITECFKEISQLLKGLIFFHITVTFLLSSRDKTNFSSKFLSNPFSIHGLKKPVFQTKAKMFICCILTNFMWRLFETKYLQRYRLMSGSTGKSTQQNHKSESCSLLCCRDNYFFTLC